MLLQYITISCAYFTRIYFCLLHWYSKRQGGCDVACGSNVVASRNFGLINGCKDVVTGSAKFVCFWCNSPPLPPPPLGHGLLIDEVSSLHMTAHYIR